MFGQNPTYLGGRSVDDAKPGIMNAVGQILNELLIQFDYDQSGIRSHPFQQLASDCADTGSEFHYDTSAVPVDLVHQVFDKEA